MCSKNDRETEVLAGSGEPTASLVSAFPKVTRDPKRITTDFWKGSCEFIQWEAL